MQGAYAFCHFFMMRHGPKNLFIISRTEVGKWYSTRKGYQVEAWIVRFVRSLGLFDMGVPEENMHICTNRSGADGKGPPAKLCRLTHMVDDHLVPVVGVRGPLRELKQEH